MPDAGLGTVGVEIFYFRVTGGQGAGSEQEKGRIRFAFLKGLSRSCVKSEKEGATARALERQGGQARVGPRTRPRALLPVGRTPGGGVTWRHTLFQKAGDSPDRA